MAGGFLRPKSKVAPVQRKGETMKKLFISQPMKDKTKIDSLGMLDLRLTEKR